MTNSIESSCCCRVISISCKTRTILRRRRSYANASFHCRQQVLCLFKFFRKRRYNQRWCGNVRTGFRDDPTTTAELVNSFEDAAKERDIRLKEDHHALKTDFPTHSLPPGEVTVSEDVAYKKRLIYRSKQRGWLEVDLLLGTWASENVMSLSEDQLRQYELILNQETLDIYNFIIERDEVPPELENQVMGMLRQFALIRVLCQHRWIMKKNEE